MMEYARTILPRVSYSKDLFRKELIKCIGWSKPEELQELKTWCYQVFYHRFPGIVEAAFSEIAA